MTITKDIRQLATETKGMALLKIKWAFLKYMLNTICILCIGRGFLSPCYVHP